MTTQEICIAICLVPQVDFTESAAQELIETLARRIQTSCFKHMDHAIQAVESLEDSATVLWNAADDIKAEQEAWRDAA